MLSLDMTVDASAIQLYLDLMKKCLTDSLWEVDYSLAPLPRSPLRHWLYRKIVLRLRRQGIRVLQENHDYLAARTEGVDWPLRAQTMIGLKRLHHLQNCLEAVLADRIPGDFIETGVWRGGAVIFMRAFLRAHGITDRIVWAADSFAGLPAPNADKYPADKGVGLHTIECLRVSLEEVQRHFSRYGLLDDQVRFLKGWFKDTLPAAPIRRLAILRMDGDLYESTMDALQHLYPKLSVGGFAIVDDYFLENCRAAVTDYRREHGIQDEIVWIDQLSAFWRKTQDLP